VHSSALVSTASAASGKGALSAVISPSWRRHRGVGGRFVASFRMAHDVVCQCRPDGRFARHCHCILIDPDRNDAGRGEAPYQRRSRGSSARCLQRTACSASAMSSRRHSSSPCPRLAGDLRARNPTSGDVRLERRPVGSPCGRGWAPSGDVTGIRGRKRRRGDRPSPRRSLAELDRIVMSSVLVGGTFMGLTALGLVAAREDGSGDPRGRLALMTACSAPARSWTGLAGYVHDRFGGFMLPLLIAALACSQPASWRSNRRQLCEALPRQRGSRPAVWRSCETAGWPVPAKP